MASTSRPRPPRVERPHKQSAFSGSQVSASKVTTTLPPVIDPTEECHANDATSTRAGNPDIFANSHANTTRLNLASLKRTIHEDSSESSSLNRTASAASNKRRRMVHTSHRDIRSFFPTTLTSNVPQAQTDVITKTSPHRKPQNNLRNGLSTIFDTFGKSLCCNNQRGTRIDNDETDNSVQEVTMSSLSQRLQSQKLVSEETSTTFSRRYPGLNAVTHSGLKLQIGDFVELKDGTFMKIHNFLHSKQAGNLVVGYVYTRADTFGTDMPEIMKGLMWIDNQRQQELDSRIPSTYRGYQILNEVVQKIRTADGERASDFGLWQRPVTDILGIRHLRCTNQDYDEDNCISAGQIPTSESLEAAQKGNWLTCRWREIVKYDKRGKVQEHRLERLPEIDADPMWRTDSSQLQEDWLGPKTLATIFEKSITFADAFCGARGVSTGAQQAGLTLRLAFDKDEYKILTYEANFPNSTSICTSAAEFIAMARRKGWKVDVLHISPPCQPYSPANTKPNEQKNEVNTTALLACADIIKCLRPRVVTIEQTTGIQQQRHQDWLHSLIHQFTELGFSVRWAVLKCADFGVPQLRKRLIVIASAPGEGLPKFPNPTHKHGAVTIKDVLEELERYHRVSPRSHHDTSQQSMNPQNPYDPNCLAKTICTDGGKNYHPDGLRQFTPREFACLQTFPLNFKFGETKSGNSLNVTELRQQIGNAVPPNLARAIFESVAKSLEEHDAETRRRLAGENNVIVLD